MLALRLKQQENCQSIACINDENGHLIGDQTQINQAFAKFYSTLYESECSGSEEELENFLRNISLPTLSENDRESLETPVLENEIKAAIKSLSTGKVPGDDGYTTEFYKCFYKCY